MVRQSNIEDSRRARTNGGNIDVEDIFFCKGVCAAAIINSALASNFFGRHTQKTTFKNKNNKKKSTKEQQREKQRNQSPRLKNMFCIHTINK